MIENAVVTDETFARLDQQYTYSQQMLEEVFKHSDYVREWGCPVVDEIAVLFPEVEALTGFVMRATEHPEIEHFNAATDVVETQPIRSAYSVRYDFLRIVGRAYRVECMALLSGFSPLHNAMRYAHIVTDVSPLQPSVVHASWKCNSEDEYAEACQVLWGHNFQRAQACDSTYGVFSYWPLTNEDGETISYLKPRFNRRDAS